MFGIPSRWITLYSSVILISIFSKVTGYFRDALITYNFGATYITDAYVLSLLIPEILFNIFGNSLTSNFVPLYYEAEKHRREGKFVSSLTSLYIIVASLIFVLGYVNSEKLIHFFSPGFHGYAFDQTQSLLKIFLSNIFSISLTYLFLAYLQANRNFIVSSFIGVANNLAIITAMVILKGPSLSVLITGTLLGYASQFLVQTPHALKLGYPAPTFKITLTPEIKKYFALSLPIAGLALLSQLNIAMDNFFASRLAEGSITTLNLGYRMLMGVYSLFITNTMMIVYPSLSKSIVNKNHSHTSELVQKTGNLLMLLLVPLSVFLMTYATSVTNVMFTRGAFSQEKSIITASVFSGYIVGLIFFALRDLLLKYFFAQNSSLIPMLNGVINSLLNFIYLLVFVPLMGLPGISLATALSAVSSFLILFALARKKNLTFKKVAFLSLGLKTLVISSFAVIITRFTFSFWKIDLMSGHFFSQLMSLLIELGFFASVYCIFLFFIYKRKIFGFRT